MTDSITSSITIDAPLDRVWELATEPGWWVDDTDDLAVNPSGGDRTPGAITVRRYRDLVFPIQVVEMNPQQRAAFRWASAFVGQELTEDNTTLIVLTFEETADGVVGTVQETGFDRLPLDDAARDQNFEANSNGWVGQLTLLRTRAAQLAV